MRLNRVKRVVDSRSSEGRNILVAAERFAGFELSDVYSSYSNDKLKAYEEVHEEYLTDLQAYDFHITTRNSFQFCVSWRSFAENGRPYTRYITAKYDYWIF